jgi:protoporphyrinogen oxidase
MIANANARNYILGAGMSGLGAALSLKVPIFEAKLKPGGICHSIYIDETGVLHDPVSNDVSSCFRFEPAGGHFIFSTHASTLKRLNHYASFKSYEREAIVFFPEQNWIVPFPIQEHLGYLDAELRNQILDEIITSKAELENSCITFKQWLLNHFGPTLCDLFFFPFNERYTAGLFKKIAPQDAYKSPIDLDRILAGSHRDCQKHGYNSIFHYPEGGLDKLVRALASEAEIHYNHCVDEIDPVKRTICFSNGKALPYQKLVSSLPLPQMLLLCGMKTVAQADPATAVLVVNIAAEIGPSCPSCHWVYLSSSKSGMHRVGFYSYVDSEFLPVRAVNKVVSLYAERSYLATHRPDASEVERTAMAIVKELQDWGFIADPILVRSSFISPAYTWSWPGSVWIDEAQEALADCGVRQMGRYGNWRFQGMADSFEQGWAIKL